MRDISEIMGAIRREAAQCAALGDPGADIAIAEAALCAPGAWSGDGAAGRAAMRSADAARARAAALAAARDAAFLSEAAADPDLRDEAIAEAEVVLSDLRRAALLGVEHADRDAIMTISAGAGGEDARDFTAMMLREVVARAERLGLSVVIEDESYDPPGLREATVRVSGPCAFALMSREAGKRRLVRISPYGSGGRQTSFCSVSVIPDCGGADISEPPSHEIRIETYRDTGPGGQHRNTTDSAVRLTHLPTGISAKSANRSQHENRRIAMRTLMARLGERARAELAAAAEASRTGAGNAGFGGHAVTLVLSPYELVRNERTGASSSDVAGWLTGGCETVR